MKQHKKPKTHNLNLSSSIIPWLYTMVGVWVYVLAYILARCNCIATDSYQKVLKNSLSYLQVIAKEKDKGRSTTASANLLTGTDKQLPKDLAAENESFPAVRKLGGLWDLHRSNAVL